ncbi:unnamed protein product, partial [Owenia fusiformis]
KTFKYTQYLNNHLRSNCKQQKDILANADDSLNSRLEAILHEVGLESDEEGRQHEKFITKESVDDDGKETSLETMTNNVQSVNEGESAIDSSELLLQLCL